MGRERSRISQYGPGLHCEPGPWHLWYVYGWNGRERSSDLIWMNRDNAFTGVASEIFCVERQYMRDAIDNHRSC